MTDAKIGQPGRFIGFANFVSLAHDQIFWLSVFNTTLYTVVASVLKFGLGLYLALLLNRRMPMKSLIRAVVLLPFVTPTVLSAIAFWWIYDPQFSIISWSLIKLGLIHQYIDFLGQPWNARWSVIAANVWRGIPFVAITLLAGLQTISPSLYEAATLDGAGPWQRFRFVTLPMLSPIIAVVMTFSVLLTFTDFQLIYAITRGGPINATHLMATLSYRAGHHRGTPRRGRGHRRRHGAVSARRHPVQLFRTAAATLATRIARLTMAARNDSSEGMDYLERLPRRLFTLYLPLAVFLFVLLFPFYWMTTTTFKPDDELYDYARFNPFWVHHPTLDHIEKLFFETSYPSWLINTMIISVASTAISLVLQRLRGLCDRTPAVLRRALCRARHLPRLSRAAQHPVHPARGDHLQAWPVRQRLGADPDLSNLPHSVLHLAA